MPPFDEGQFLYMPTVMPHASLGQALEQLRLMDAAIMQIPEVELRRRQARARGQRAGSRARVDV